MPVTTLATDTRVLPLVGELCIATLPVVRTEIDRIIGDGGRHLVLDLDGASLLTAAALRVFDTTEKRLLRLGGGLQLARPRPLPRRVLEITGFDRLLRPIAA